MCLVAAVCKPGRQPSKSASTLILDFPASRILRNKCLLFKPSPVSGILIEQPKLTETDSGTKQYGAAIQNI